jgi:hypothetical protein
MGLKRKGRWGGGEGSTEGCGLREVNFLLEKERVVTGRGGIVFETEILIDRWRLEGEGYVEVGVS